MNGKHMGWLAACTLVCLAVGPAAWGQRDRPLINEFVANHTGTDTHEFVEIFGAPNTDYSPWTVLEVEGDGAGAGTIDGAWPVGTTNAGGFWTTGFLSNEIENGTMSLLLVEDFFGNVGDDLDTDNNGALNSIPWASGDDCVAVTDGDAGDLTYCAVVLTPNYDGLSPYHPGGASRIPNGTDTNSVGDWVRNDFDGAGLASFVGTPDAGEALNTPGAVNQLVPEPCTAGLMIAGTLLCGVRRRRRRGASR